MRTFKNTIIPKEYRGSAIALGNFDGVHRGHQKVFRQAKKYAKKNKIKYGELTYTPLPVMFYNRNIKLFVKYEYEKNNQKNIKTIQK